MLNKKGAVVGQDDSIAAHVAGTGDIQGTPVVITGTIKAKGIGTEAVSSPMAHKLDLEDVCPRDLRFLSLEIAAVARVSNGGIFCA